MVYTHIPHRGTPSLPGPGSPPQLVPEQYDRQMKAIFSKPWGTGGKEGTPTSARPAPLHLGPQPGRQRPSPVSFPPTQSTRYCSPLCLSPTALTP